MLEYLVSQRLWLLPVIIMLGVLGTALWSRYRRAAFVVFSVFFLSAVLFLLTVNRYAFSTPLRVQDVGPLENVEFYYSRQSRGVANVITQDAVYSVSAYAVRASRGDTVRIERYRYLPPRLCLRDRCMPYRQIFPTTSGQ